MENKVELTASPTLQTNSKITQETRYFDGSVEPNPRRRITCSRIFKWLSTKNSDLDKRLKKISSEFLIGSKYFSDLPEPTTSSEEYKNFFERNFTPLLDAIRTNQVEICRFLLKSGASVSTQTDWGMSPYNAIKIYRPSKKNEIKMLFKEILEPELFAEAREYDKELRIKSLIGHIVELQGITHFVLKNRRQEYKSVDLEGSNACLMFEEVSKNINLFSKCFSNIMNTETSSIITEAFQAAANQKNISFQEKITSWKMGKPLIIGTGYGAHWITVLLWGQNFVLCNRNENLKAYTFKGDLLSEEILKNIEDLKSSPYENVQFFSEILPRLLQFSCKSIQAIACIDIGCQIVGNCAYASAEGLVLPLLILNSCRKARLDVSDYNDKIVEITKEQTKIYENWKVFHRLTVLQKYYKRCLQESPVFIPDTALLSRAVRDESFAKSLPDLSARLDPQLLFQWQDFYNEYCKTTIERPVE